MTKAEKLAEIEERHWAKERWYCSLNIKCRPIEHKDREWLIEQLKGKSDENL